MRKYRKHQEYLIESLKDTEEASAYLKACLDRFHSVHGKNWGHFCAVLSGLNFLIDIPRPPFADAHCDLGCDMPALWALRKRLKGGVS